MRNYVQPGNVVPVALSAAVKAGDVVIVGSLAGIAATSGETGDEVEVSLSGVFELPKGSVPITQGARLFWDAANKLATATAGSNVFIGHAFRPALTADVVVDVRLVQA